MHYHQIREIHDDSIEFAHSRAIRHAFPELTTPNCATSWRLLLLIRLNNVYLSHSTNECAVHRYLGIHKRRYLNIIAVLIGLLI